MEVEIHLPDLRGYQNEWVEDMHRFKAIEGATGTGKTHVFAPELFREAHQPVNDGDEYWWVAPTLFQARAVFEDIERRLSAADALDFYDISRAPMSITTPGGGVMRFLTADNPDYLYGVRNVRKIIGDEFTRWRISMWAALLSVANKTGATITLIGNYVGETSAWHLWVETMEAEPEFRYWRTTALEAVAAGIMPQAMLDTARRTLPSVVFDALYLCKGSVDESLLVEYGAVADLWTNEQIQPGRPAMTCDLAFQGSDRFVMGIWAGMVLREIAVFEKLEATEAESIIREKAKANDIPLSRIVYDADGMGHYLKSYLRGAVSYQGGTSPIPQQGAKLSFLNLRSQCHFKTADAINARSMYISTTAHREELEQEIFAGLRTNGQNASLKYGIYPKDHADQGSKARLGRSPDILDMIVMRQYLELTPPGQLIQGIHQGAEKSRRIQFNRAEAKRKGPIFGGR